MKKKLHYQWWLVFAVAFLVIPSAIYLGFLIPKMHSEYIALMSSGGVIGVGGMFGASMIPDTVKFGALYKTASKSFTLLVIITLVKDFIGQLIGLCVCFAVSYIVFMIFKELYKNGKQTKQNEQLAAEITRSITKATE